MDFAREILERYRTWAIVGISGRPDRDSHRVASFLRERGYRIVPVNPSLDSWEDVRAFPDLHSIPFSIEVVDLFRRSEAVEPHVDEAIRIGAKAVWMQLGVRSGPAAARARSAGLAVVEDRCPVIEIGRLWPTGGGPRFESDQ